MTLAREAGVPPVPCLKACRPATPYPIQPIVVLGGLKAAENFTREAQILGEGLADAGYQTWRQTKTIPDKSIGTKAIWTVAKKFYAAPEQQKKFAATAIEFLNAQQNRLMLLPAQ
jgi:hypothetical protein